MPATTPYRCRHPGISNRGIAPETGTSDTTADVIWDWWDSAEDLPRCPAAPPPRPLPIHPLDLGSQSPEPFVDAFVPAFYLANIVNRAATFGRQCRE